MSRFIIGACATLAMGLLAADDASADHFRFGGRGRGISVGYSSPGFSIGIGSNRGFNRGFRGGYGGGYYGGRTTRVWHDTSHYDYHPTTAYRHGNHYHVQPGHYDLHGTGHVDTIRRGRVIHGRDRTVYRGHRH